MKETAKERLLQFLEYKGIGQNKFEKAVGLSIGYINKLRHEPSPTKLRLIINTYPELDENWLLTGEGAMLKDDPAQTASPKPYTDTPVPGGQPYYDVDFIGGFDIIFNDQTNVPAGFINLPAYRGENVVWCNITGHSMEPMINHGDIIGIRELQDWHTYLPKGEVYGIVTTNGLRTVKIIRKGSDPQHILLQPVNTTDYDPEEIPLTSILRVFTVLANIKRF